MKKPTKYILYGDDEKQILQQRDKIRQAHGIDRLLVFHAPETDQREVLNEMDSFSIFDEKKMICITGCSFLSARDMTKYDAESFLVRMQDDSVVIVFEHNGNLSSRKKEVKTLISLCKCVECTSLNDKNRLSYLKDRMKETDLRMEPKALDWMAARIGDDPLKIDQELYKLRTYGSDLRLQDVQALLSVEPVSDVFKMVDALFERNTVLLLNYYRNFRSQNMEPVAILGLLSGQIRFLFQVRVLMDRGMRKDEIAKTLSAHPYRIQLNMKKAEKYSAQELLDWLELLGELDQKTKMGMIDKDLGFEEFILKKVS